ncbi:MAG: glycosyltransferase family 2 protein [Burkholderiales bacterium]
MQIAPRVSVGLPVYNGERYLAPTVETILGQTFEDFELIIADNASTDETARIAQDFAKRDARVRYIRNATNIGAIANFNLVFRLARGEYFKWNGYDDTLAPDYLEKCVRMLDERPGFVICHSRTQEVDHEGKIVPSPDPKRRLDSDRVAERFWDVLMETHHINENYGVIRSDVLRRTRLELPFHGSDKVLLAELMVLGKCYEIPEFLFTRGGWLAKAQHARTRKSLELYDNPNAKPGFNTLRTYVAYCQVVRRMPMSIKERIGCCKALLAYLFSVTSWKKRVKRLLHLSRVRSRPDSISGKSGP